MAKNTYNGWANRETWLVNIWFEPESREDVEFAREGLLLLSFPFQCRQRTESSILSHG